MSTSASAVIAGGDTETGIFDDLGTGASYGSTEVSGSGAMPEMSITLSAAALSDLNALLVAGLGALGLVRRRRARSDRAA